MRHRSLVSCNTVSVTTLSIGNGPTMVMPESTLLSVSVDRLLAIRAKAPLPTESMFTAMENEWWMQSSTMLNVAPGLVQSRQPTSHAHSICPPLWQLDDPSEVRSEEHTSELQSR